jgi:type II secretory pathway component GspD/PulD (secretin)
VKEGERLVIGGVINETDATQVRQVPFLGSIPILGWLFKSREISGSGSELIVIITPTVLKLKGS